MTNKEMINKFKDYADCADASYAMLDFVNGFVDYSAWYEKKDIEFEGNQSLGDKLEGTNKNSTYARSIQARFNQDSKISDFSVTEDSKRFHKEKGHNEEDAIDNDPKNVSPTNTLSTRTKNFVNRYELIEHQPNADSGFSATLFKDTKAEFADSEYILAFRGTEYFKDIFEANVSLIGGVIPKKQYMDMLDFYVECIEKEHITKSTLLESL